MVRTAQVDMVGRTLGDFKVLERVSTGGMGTVYKAHQRGMDRMVAIKVLPDELADNPVALERFRQEARSAARLDHPNIVRAISIGEQDGVHFFAMEFVDGESLSKRLKRDGPLDEPEAIRVITCVAEALASAHNIGIIHRDVKPENVLITSSGQVKLADFGLVKRLDQDLGLTQAGRGLGTTNYMAPEQFKDAKHADVRCDVYGLGATLYAALTGVVPWAGLDPAAMYKQKMAANLPPPRKVRPEISAAVEAVILRAMHVEPGRRFADCAAFVTELGGKPARSLPGPIEEVATRAAVDLSADAAIAPGRDVAGGTWFVRFFEKGQRRQQKLRTQEIRQAIKSGRLAENMRLSRTENGPWMHLSAFQEFVDLVAQLSRGAKEQEMQSDIERTVAALHAGAPLRQREQSRGWLIFAGIAVLAIVALVVWLLLR